MGVNASCCGVDIRFINIRHDYLKIRLRLGGVDNLQEHGNEIILNFIFFRLICTFLQKVIPHKFELRRNSFNRKG